MTCLINKGHKMKSFITAFNSAEFNAPIAVIADALSNAPAVEVTATIVDTKKIRYNVTISGMADDGTGQSGLVTIGVNSDDGKLKTFDNLDNVVALAKNVFTSAAQLNIVVQGVPSIRGVQTLSGDPLATQARALAKVTAKKQEATALVASQSAGLAVISYYSTGNSVEQAYYSSKAQQLASTTAYAAWLELERVRLGGAV